MGGSRNRTAGLNEERSKAKKVREVFKWPHVVTSRAESRTRDDQKVDLINHNEYENGRMIYDFQIKNTTVNVNYHKLIGEMPDLEETMPVILHKKTEKKNDRFLPVGEYAIMKADDWFKQMGQLEEFKRKEMENGE